MKNNRDYSYEAIFPLMQEYYYDAKAILNSYVSPKLVESCIILLIQYYDSEEVSDTLDVMQLNRLHLAALDDNWEWFSDELFAKHQEDELDAAGL
jgi:hypothetical protein